MREKIKNNFYDIKFLFFILIGVVNTFNGILFAFLSSLFIENSNLSFIFGYIISLTISYVLNSLYNFKSELNFRKYYKFCLSYIPNFLIQNIIVIIFLNILNFDKLFVFAIASIIGIPITFLFIKTYAFENH